MDANYSNGSSVYHGLTANLRKRFSNHYEFLASYTWSHAIDDSTDLQSHTDAAGQLFTRAWSGRRRCLINATAWFSAACTRAASWRARALRSKFFSDWTFAPIVEIVFRTALQHHYRQRRQLPVFVAAPAARMSWPRARRATCGYATVASKFSPTGFFQEPCFADLTPHNADADALLLDGNLGRNAGVRPWTVFNDLRVARRIYFGERMSMDLIADMFNIANVYNVADVNPLFTNAGQATAAYDPRQFQFALKLNW